MAVAEPSVTTPAATPVTSRFQQMLNRNLPRTVPEPKVPDEKPAPPATEKPAAAATPETLPPAKEPETPAPARDTRTLGEIVADANARAKEPKKPETPPPAKEEPAKPVAVVEPEKPKGEDKKPPASEPPKEPAVKVRTKRSEPLPPPPEAPPPAAPATPAAEKTIEERAGLTLDEDARAYLEMVSYAEKDDPTKKGLLDREIARFKRYDQFVKNWEKDHAGEVFDPNSDDDTREAFRKLQREQPPALNRAQVSALEKKKLREEVRAEVTNEFKDHLSPVQRELRALQERPKIESEVAAVEKDLIKAVPEELSALASKGLDALIDENPVEGAVVASNIRGAKILVDEFLSLERGVKVYDPNKITEPQKVLADLIYDAGTWWRDNGGDDRIQNGKQFLPMHELRALEARDPKTASKYFTFSPQQVVQIIKDRATKDMKDSLDQMRGRLEKAGYVRKSAEKAPEAHPATNGTEPKKHVSPSASPKPSGGTVAEPRKTGLDAMWSRHRPTKFSA